MVSATTPATHSAAPTATMTAVPSSDAAKTIGSSTGSKGMSNGAVAGIAIGMLIIGAALAFLAAFLLFKRRKRPSSHPYGESTPELVSPLKGKGTPYVEVSQNAVPAPVLSTPVAPTKRGLDLTNLANSSDFLAAVLPPAADEQMVKNKIVTLFNEISHHVDSYYRDVHATTTPTMESDLAKFGSGSINLLEMLQNSSMPTVAIKHALATYILSIVSPEAEDQATLFPTEISGLKENERSTQRPGRFFLFILTVCPLTIIQMTKPPTSSTSDSPSISIPRRPHPSSPASQTSARPPSTLLSPSSHGRTPHTTIRRKTRIWSRP